jgi:hypothetical protein
MIRIHPLLLLISQLALLAGCPKEGAAPPAKTSSPASWTDEQQAHEAGVALSLFKDTPMINNPPDAISFSRDGSILWAHGLDRQKNEFYLSQSEVLEDSLNPTFFKHGPDMVVSYVQASPNGEECLMLSQYQPKTGGPVRDVIYRVGADLPEDLDNRSIVPWEHLPGLPEMQEEVFAFTKPLYSWDGATIVIPFNGTTGAAVVSRKDGSGQYVAYPKTTLPHGYTGTAFGPLPDEDGKRRIWGSFWYRGGDGNSDQTEVYMLDLDSLKWELAFKVGWPVYHCTATQPSVQPWLVSGAYSHLTSGDQQASEYQRSGYYIPRLARIVPGAGTEDILPVYGEPVWDIALDPLGGKVFFTDMQRKSLTRYSPADGKLEFDPRWYTADDMRTQVFCCSGGNRCFVWQAEVLIQAEFSKQEQHTGYER